MFLTKMTMKTSERTPPPHTLLKIRNKQIRNIPQQNDLVLDLVKTVNIIKNNMLNNKL